MCQLISALASIGNFFGIGISKIWLMLADSLNITTLLIFSNQIVLHLYFLSDRNNFLFTKALTHVTKGKATNHNRTNETKFFCESIAYCFAQLNIVQHVLDFSVYALFAKRCFNRNTTPLKKLVHHACKSYNSNQRIGINILTLNKNQYRQKLWYGYIPNLDHLFIFLSMSIN